MNEKQTVRPTKKQTELLRFIEQFISEHGYSPSYREVMNGCNYTSVATVALHINSLISRGHLRKRDHSARSLEVVNPAGANLKITTNQVAPGEEKWLVDKVEQLVTQLESSADHELATGLEKVTTLLQALKVLDLEAAAQSFASRVQEVYKRHVDSLSTSAPRA